MDQFPAGEVDQIQSGAIRSGFGAACFLKVEQQQAPGDAGVAADCNSAPGESPLRKLSTLQYQHTVRDLLAASGIQMTAAVDPILEGLPADSRLTFSGLDNRLSSHHVSTWFSVASTVGDRVESDPAVRTALLGASCATAGSLTAACVDTFVSTFARRALRRPLTEQERAGLRALNDGVRPPAEALRAMVFSVLMAL